jgi:hypothetical protein
VYGALSVRDGQVLKRDRPRTQHRWLSCAAARRRRNLSAGRSLPDRRPFGQPPEWADPGVASGPPADPARLHSGRRRLAEPHRRLVAALPPQSLRGRVVSQRRGYRLRHRHRHHSAQPSRPPLDLGTAGAATPLAPTLLHVSLLRNDALSTARPSGLIGLADHDPHFPSTDLQLIKPHATIKLCVGQRERITRL